MATFTRPAQLMAHMQRRATTHIHSMRDAHRELIAGGKRDYAQYTSGRVSTRQLRQMGHPFGRQAGGGIRGVGNGVTTRALGKHAQHKGNRVRKGVLAPLPINVQSGEMRRSFFQTQPSGADLRVDMGFASPHAQYVLAPRGTRRMVARGFHSISTSSGGPSMAGLGIIAKRHRARKAGIIAAARRKYMFP